MFTRVAKFIAWFGIIAGGLSLLGGLIELADGNRNGVGLLLVLSGIAAIMGSVALGVLYEISMSASKSNGTGFDASKISRDTGPLNPSERIKWANREPPYNED